VIHSGKNKEQKDDRMYTGATDRNTLVLVHWKVLLPFSLTTLTV